MYGRFGALVNQTEETIADFLRYRKWFVSKKNYGFREGSRR